MSSFSIPMTIKSKKVWGCDVLLEKLNDRDVWHITIPAFIREDFKPVYWMAFDEQEANDIFNAVTKKVIGKLVRAKTFRAKAYKMIHEADMLIVRRK